MWGLLKPCSLHSGVQSYANFWLDRLAIPFIPHCQSALCSLPPVLLPNCNNCWTPQLTLIPPQQRSCHFSSVPLCPFWFFYSAFLVHHFFSFVAFTHFLNVWLINWPFRYNNGKEDGFLCISLPTTERQECSLKLWLLSPVAYLFGGLIQGLIHWWVTQHFKDLDAWVCLQIIITLLNTGRIYSENCKCLKRQKLLTKLASIINRQTCITDPVFWAV